MNDPTADLLCRWQAGDQQAADEIFRRYADGLIALARRRLPGKLARRVDAEDVVQSAYRSFFAGARAGRFDPERGGDLWRLLVAITLHKLRNQLDRHTAEKRSIDAEQNFGSEDSFCRIQTHRLAHEPSPVEALALVDELEQVMGDLEPLQRRMLDLRLQGYNLAEIAAETQRCPRTVLRALERVKLLMEQRYTVNGRS